MQHSYYIDMNKKYFSTSEAGEILGLDRTQVFRLIQAGKIHAIKIGKGYAISAEELGLDVESPTDKEKMQVTEAVDKVFDQYGDVIKKLGEE